MTHLDLFSGIGGFALAADWVWPGIEHVFCDNDLFCQAVLKKHWPKAKIYGDIRTLTADAERKRHVHGQAKEQPTKGHKQTQREPIASTEPPFLLTGGFPCQPFSQAGRRKGTADDRHLWPEMLRVVREFSPTWVVGENVRGLTNWEGGVVFEQVQADLEFAGYEVQPFIIPAVAVNAPHRRDRVWIVAHRKDDRGGGWDSKERRNERIGELVEKKQGRNQAWDKSKGRISWNENWLEVATRLCTLDDGLPNGLVRPRGWRNAALKAAGNAIVPQVAYEIMKAIKLSNP